MEREYELQLESKEKQILSQLSFFQDLRLEPSQRSATQYFRNRAKMIVSGTATHPKIGIRDEEILSCPIHHPKLNQVFSTLPSLLAEARIVPYHIADQTGDLKGLIAYYSPESDQMYLRFVMRSRAQLERIRGVALKLQKNFSYLRCISMNLQPIPHSILEGREEIFITERESIDHPIGIYALQLSPQAFVQTNFEVARALYETAAGWIKELAPLKLLELYCGQGVFSFFASAHAQEILGIEINQQAVAAARESAKNLGYSHLNFKCLDATQVSDEWTAFGPDCVLVNPPRKGLGEGVQLILAQKPKFLLYSSCLSETLSADLNLLKNDYSLKKVRLFDMFPHTEHFETLVLLERIRQKE